MPIDPESPEGRVFERLAKKLLGRQQRLERLASYYQGDPPLPEGIERLRQVARDFFKASRTNFAELVTEAPRERMQPSGIRTGADDGEAGDAAAWAAWVRAGLPVLSADVHQSMLGLGDGYVIVAWDGDRGRAVPTAEDPRQVVTEHDPLEQRRVLAGLKMYRDHVAKQDVAYVYLPGKVLVARRPASDVVKTSTTFDLRAWDWDEDLSRPLPRGFEDVVPVVRFRNREGVGEFERHIDVLDRINRMMLRRIVIATYQAFRQRAIKGDLPETDEAGNVIDYNKALEAGPDALWLLPPDVDIWESNQVNLQDILSAVKDDVLFLAAVTRTPLAMLTPDAAAQSAEGASLQREGLVFKTEDRIARASDGWSQVVSLMFRFAGDAARGDLDRITLLWAPVERYSIAERGSAWAQTQGLPFETRLRLVFGMGPDEIARVKTERQAELLQAALASVRADAAQPAPAVA